MKIYTNRKGVKYQMIPRYYVFRLTEDGLLKDFDSDRYPYTSFSRQGYSTEEEAIEEIGKQEAEAVIIKRIEIDYNPVE